MRRQNILIPMSILIAGFVLIVMLMTVPNAQSVQPKQDYPQQTQTALAYGGPTAQSTNTSTSVPSNIDTASTPIPTSTPTEVSTATATILSSIPTPTQIQTQAIATRTIFATAQSNTIALTPTATPTNLLLCNPGQPIEITGEGTPYAGFLLYFGNRVVSGGSVSASGQFSIQLIVGEELAGEYSVVVRERNTKRVLRELVCIVPATTPTPLPGLTP